MTIAAQLTDINNSKQAIKTAIEGKGVTVGSAPFNQYAGLINNITAGSPPEPRNPWVRNPSWLALPTVLPTENKVVALHRLTFNPRGNSFDTVYDQSNFVAFSATTQAGGGYTVNWGDGTTTSHSTGATALKLYDSTNMAAVPDSTRAPVTFTAATNTVERTAHGYKDGFIVSFAQITTTTGIERLQQYYVVNSTVNTFQISREPNGPVLAFTNNGTGFILPYKQVIITITPNGSNTFTSLNFNIRHTQAGLQSNYCTGWLDMIISGPSLSSLNFATTATNVTHGALEQFQLISTNTISNFNGFFNRCFSLKSVPKFVLRTTGTCTMNNFFWNCHGLTHAPVFTDINGNDAAPRITSVDTMFRFCHSLQYVPNYNLSSCTNFNTMLGDCFSLERAPFLNTSAATQMINMFFGSPNIKYVPDYNTSNCTAMGEIFRGCNLLEEYPAFNLNAVSSSANLNNQLFQCFSVKRHRGTGARFTHSIANCHLSNTALNEYYTNLPTVTGQTLTVTGNWGAATSTTSIATAKGWAVTI
jgi:hypothetical protein